MNSAPSTGTLAVGDEIELEITNIAHGGVCVARHEGRVVFVSDTIPGERVVARVTEARKKSFARASSLRVLEASPHRRPHVWPEAALERDPDERAGGAEFGHIDLAHQRELKAFVLRDALQRFAGIERDVTVNALPGDDERNGLGYRTRVRLHVDEEGRVGPFAARSNRVVEVASLPLAVDELNQIAPLSERMLGLSSVDLIAPSGADVDEHGAGLGDPRMLLSYLGERTPVGADDLMLERVSGIAGERAFQVNAGGFWQVHREAANTLSRAVSAAVLSLSQAGRFTPDAHNLDLYGGVGLLAAAMGDAAEVAGVSANSFKVTSVESDERATDHAAENLAEWVGAMAVTDRVDRYLKRLLADAGGSSSLRERIAGATVLLDPPRSGAAAEVTSTLLDLAPANIVYVACDPVALARDLGALAAGNGSTSFELTSLEGFDLFPHTHHVEAIAVLERRS